MRKKTLLLQLEKYKKLDERQTKIKLHLTWTINWLIDHKNCKDFQECWYIAPQAIKDAVAYSYGSVPDGWEKLAEDHCSCRLNGGCRRKLVTEREKTMWLCETCISECPQ